MSATHYCHIHGSYTVYNGEVGGCPDCQRLSSDNKDILEQLANSQKANVEIAAQVIYRTNNPGDYECPACKMISLKTDASRCPLCRSDVPSEFWDRIRLRKQLEDEKRRQAEEDRQKWLASPEYAKELETARLAAEAAALSSPEAEKKRRVKFQWRLTGIIMLCVAMWVFIHFPHSPDDSIGARAVLAILIGGVGGGFWGGIAAWLFSLFISQFGVFKK